MKIAIIGCGNMGLIYARAFLKYNIVKNQDLFLVEKNELRAKELHALGAGQVITLNDPRLGNCDILLISVKPQDFSQLSGELVPLMRKGMLVLSIMAGKSISHIREALNHEQVIRAMPNAPVELGMGVTAYCMHPCITPEEGRRVEHLLNTTGRTVYLEDESLLDAVTALSGSGPAYFYYVVKHMIKAGLDMGFDEGVSSLLVKQTMLGAFHLLNSSAKSPDELIAAVASKGGTTEAALNWFNAKEVGTNIEAGIIKAKIRGGELSKI